MSQSDEEWAKQSVAARLDPLVNEGNLSKVLAPVANVAQDEVAEDQITLNDFFGFNPLTIFGRRDLIDMLINPRRRINFECGYPESPDQFLYYMLYKRDPIAGRVVKVLPEESWKKDPVVFEDSNDAWETPKTAFEIAWKELAERLNVWFNLHLFDELSGIGHFGVLLLGVDGGEPLSMPLDGLNNRGERIVRPEGSTPRKLLYLRVFNETVVRVRSREGDKSNPRFGMPTSYTIIFQETSLTELGDVGPSSVTTTTATEVVHWTRVIHFADNQEGSKIYGCPRIQPVLDPVLDLRKIRGASGEGYWRCGIPSYSLELSPGVSPNDISATEKAEIKKQMREFGNSSERYLMTGGLQMKSQASQIADPTPHASNLKEDIAVRLGVPMRVFLGSERGELASSQDSDAHDDRIGGRQEKTCTPMIVRPFVDRLIDVGVLPKPKLYKVEWPDLSTTTETEKAEVGVKRTQALAAFVQSGADAVVPPDEWQKTYMGMDAKVVDEIAEARDGYERLEGLGPEPTPEGEPAPGEKGAKPPGSKAAAQPKGKGQ